MKQTTTQRIWKAGTNTYVVTVPKSIIAVQNLEVGDYLEVTMQKLQNETTEYIKTERKKTNTKKRKGIFIS